MVITKNKIKIASIISDTRLETMGGLAKSLKTLLTFLDQNSTQNFVITYQYDAEEEAFFSNLSIPMFSLLKDTQFRELNPIETIQSLTEILKQIKPDVVQTSNHWADFYGRKAAIRAKVPVIIAMESNMIPNETESYRKSKLNLALKSDRIVCISNGVKNYAHTVDKIPEHLLTTIYSSVILSDYPFKPFVDQNLPYQFVFVARLENQKNPQLLIKAFARLRQQNYDAELNIIGEGSLKKECIKLTQNLEISERVKFLGYKDKPWEFVLSGSIFVLSSDFEGLGNSILEAMATGCLSILPKIEPALEIAQEDKEAIFYNTGDVDDLTAKMKLVFEMSDNQKRKMINNARQKIENQFTAQKTADKYLDLYRQLLSRTLKL